MKLSVANLLIILFCSISLIEARGRKKVSIHNLFAKRHHHHNAPAPAPAPAPVEIEQEPIPSGLYEQNGNCYCPL